jgi:hypothetical protein
MSAEPRRSTPADAAERLPLLLEEQRAPALKELALVSVEDIGHFQPTSCYVLLLPPQAVRVTRIGRSSSGLSVACSLARSG